MQVPVANRQGGAGDVCLIEEIPTLIRIETNAGHGAGKPVSKTIEEYADIFAFTFYNMGYDTLPNQEVLKEFKD